MKRRYFYSLREWRRWWCVYPIHAGFLLSALKVGLVAASAGAGWIGVLSATWAWVIVALLFLCAFFARIFMQPVKYKRPRRNDAWDEYGV